MPIKVETPVTYKVDFAQSCPVELIPPLVETVLAFKVPAFSAPFAMSGPLVVRVPAITTLVPVPKVTTHWFEVSVTNARPTVGKARKAAPVKVSRAILRDLKEVGFIWWFGMDLGWFGTGG